MINRKGAPTASTQRVCIGPLAHHADKFTEFLADEGYASRTIAAKCALVVELSHWLQRQALPLARLDENRLKQFYTHRRSPVRRGDVSTGYQLVQLLRRLGVIPSLPPKIDQTALGLLAQEYERYLSSERGLAGTTVAGHLHIVRRFLTEHSGNKALRLQALHPQDLYRFIFREGRRVSRTHARTTVTALRSFLRFLRQRGAIETDLAAALFGVAT